jgi:hypothetical protein
MKDALLLLAGELRLRTSYKVNYGLDMVQMTWKWRHW